ncbi:MAG: molybdopterin-dependent oxidoreductase [Salinisphaeraceae bacterium]
MTGNPQDSTPIRLEVNGEAREALVPSRLLLVDYLRQELRLTGTHTGCDDARCGACTVRVDGAPVKSCMMLARQADGCAVETVEALGTADRLSVLQRAFRRRHGLQCGYCTPGMLNSAQALLERNSEPDEAGVRAALVGNLCRCTGYQNIVAAVLDAAAELRGDALPVADESRPATDGDKWVGRSTERVQDTRLLTGQGRYVADLADADTLHAAILRSPHAHARIRRIDTSAARAMPGVVQVLTGAEAVEFSHPLPPTIDIGMRMNESHAIAVDKVRYHGEPVAAVAATDPYIAEDALAKIVVDYELLEPVVDIDQALADDAPRLYEDWPDNRCLEYQFSDGPIDQAFAEATHTVVAEIPHHRYTAVPMEGRVALAHYRSSEGRLTLRLSTQSPHQCRTLLAQTLDLPEARIEVICKDVGGGFGLKLQVDGEVIPCLLSMRTGRPVLWAETREENLLSGIHARDYCLTMEGAFDNDGRLLGLRTHLLGNCGCDGTNRAAGAGQLLVGAFYFPGNYKVPAYSTDVVGLVSNKAPYGAYRGYGKDIANHGIERFMNIAARQLGMDANELRRRNLIQPDEFPYEILTGPIYDSGDYPELLAMAEAGVDLAAFRKRQAEARAAGRYLGVGFAMMLEPAGGAVPNSIFNAYETATVRMMPQGDFLLLTGMQDIGQGVETTLAQVVADEFGVTPDRINVVFGDTHGAPYGLGAWSSRGASFGVSAAVEAARKLARRLRAIGARMMECDTDAVTLRDGAVQRTDGAASLAFRDLGNAVSLWPGPHGIVPEGEEPNLEATATWTNPVVRWVPNDAGSLSIYATHPSGCFAVIVEVDAETGAIRVDRVYAAHDCGTVINPTIVNGQLHGGCVQGLGAVLGEELRYDEQGHLLNKGFWDYLIPQAPDVPNIEIGHLVCPSPNTPLGTKGMGEGGPVGIPAAVMNAVEDALSPLDVQLSELPLSPERVLAAIDAARSQRAPS